MDLAEKEDERTMTGCSFITGTSHRQGVLTVNERRREKRIKTNAEVRSL